MIASQVQRVFVLFTLQGTEATLYNPHSVDPVKRSGSQTTKGTSPEELAVRIVKHRAKNSPKITGLLGIRAAI